MSCECSIRAAVHLSEPLRAMYSLEQFASMFSDKVRMDAYSAAIAHSVRPSDAVLDLGCGPGVFALLACKAGARRVYAIDMNGVVDFGRQLAAANGFSDRIVFMRGDSRQIHLPERVNVLVSDVRGVLPLFSNAIDTLQDARDRFLVQGGQLIPSRDTLYAAIVALPGAYQQLVGAWKAVPHLDLAQGLPLVLNTIHRHHIKPDQVVSEPRAQETVYGHLFLPWIEPVPLDEGEVCSTDLRAHLVGTDYIWQWETSIPAARGHQEVRFAQSTFYGSLFPPSVLQKRAMGFVPVLDESGQAERWLLQAMDGKRHLEEIAAEAVRQFPHVFRRVEDAFNRAAEIAEKYSR